MSNARLIITIDGPVASGKSSVARELAHRLNIYYLYTGLLYRAVAYVLLHYFRRTLTDRKELDLTEQEIAAIAEIEYGYDDNQPFIRFRGDTLTEKLYELHLDEASSIVSANVIVRGSLLSLQREIAEKYDLIADGRDCGTVIFPNADFKFYLTADVEVRAKRVFQDTKRKVMYAEMSVVRKNVELRDERDRNRSICPLVVPKDAVVVDNSQMSFEQTIEAFLGVIQNKK